jgi:predicted dehydrogenase
MVGGGPGAFIGEVHRQAAALDGEIQLVAGAFSADEARSSHQGELLGLDSERTYASFHDMAAHEAALPASRRIDFVSIVTPNHLHYEVARLFLDAGFHVVCDKPLCTTVEEAEALCRLVEDRGAVFALTHNYTGYPLVKQARALVGQGRLGELRKVVVDYSQGWLATRLEDTGHKQAEWRTDPARAGIGGALGDIGTHAENLVSYVTGLELESLCAEVSAFVEGRALDDDANLLLRYHGGARGVMSVSQIAVGKENDLRLSVHGSEASLHWRQESPDTLRIQYADRPAEVHRRGGAYLAPVAAAATRLPPGHPEGFIEAFANIYRNAAGAMAAHAAGTGPTPHDLDFPTVQDGARGVFFVHRAVESARAGGWVEASYTPPGG